MRPLVYTDTATGQQIVFPAYGWTVKRLPGNTTTTIISPTGNMLRIPDEVADAIARSLSTLHKHTRSA